MKSILEKKGELKGKTVLLRLSLNVPLIEGKVESAFKLMKVLPTIEFLRNEGAKILLLGYIGRKGVETLEPVAEFFRKFFLLTFKKDILNKSLQEEIEKMKEGEVFLFENLRQYEGEENNDTVFAQEIASLGDIYVNEAFPDSHRAYASIVGIPKFLDSYFGFSFIKEVGELNTLSKTERPRLFVLGGNKLKTKLPFIEKVSQIADYVFVGGALSNEVFKFNGWEVGNSILSGEDFDLTHLLENKKIIIPIDVVVENEKGEVLVKKPNEVQKDEVIMDLGPESLDLLKNKIKNSRFVLWNGPIGDYKKGYLESTFDLIKTIVDSKAESIAGGGDTALCIEKLKLQDRFDFISAGGGAMLDYVIDGTLVGIDAIK
ncbi:MAG: phosphoglycerate kinase [Patescibacteria group bacterium]